MVPTRTYAVRGPWEADFAFAEGRRDGNFIPCAGAKRLVHCFRRRRRDGVRRGGGGGARRGLRGVRAQGEVPRQRHAEGTRRHDDGNPQYREVHRLSHPLPGRSDINIHIGRIPGSSSTAARPVTVGDVRRFRLRSSRLAGGAPPPRPAGRRVWGRPPLRVGAVCRGRGPGAVPRRRPRERRPRPPSPQPSGDRGFPRAGSPVFPAPSRAMIHTLSRSTEARNAPGSISSFSRNAFGSFIPFAQRIARRVAEGGRKRSFPRGRTPCAAPWEAPFPFAAGSRDANFIPSPGAKRLFHSSGGVAGTPGPAGDAAACAVPFGEYASRPR